MSTVGKERNPWETYGDDLIGRDSPELDKAVEEYSKHRHEKSSAQNEEELSRWQEENRNIAKEYQFVKPEDYSDEGARIGKILSHDEFIRLLRNKLKLRCWYKEMGHPQKIALWVLNNERIGPQCAGWVKRGLTTEFSIMRFDQHGAPLDEKFRGWRTVLMNLVMKGFLREQDVRKVFGRAEGPASEKYNAHMQHFRAVV